jgi:iron(III) transport system substrate-binding protein
VWRGPAEIHSHHTGESYVETSLGWAAILTLTTAGAVWAADDAALVEAATKEGALSIYTSTDIAQAQGLLDAFTAKYPGIRVDYNDVGTNGAYNRVIAEAAAQQMGGDIVWSSAMDLQMKLAADGYFEPYASPEAGAVPDWGKYQDMLYATTIEPVGIIYNKLALSEDKVPHTRSDLIAFLGDPEVAGKVATFDPEKSGSGFLLHTNDLHETSDFWDLAAAFSAAQGKTYSSTGSVKETVVSGENVLAFNIIGSYGLE